jgi:hypothetical protein
MSGKAIRDAIGFLGVITSLVFVGMELRQSNVQARAAAYQEIGIATANFHYDTDAVIHRLNLESLYPEAIAQWDGEDWERYFRYWVAGFRLAETVLLQIEQGVLPPDAMQRLGYSYFRIGFLSIPAAACVWSQISSNGAVAPALIEYVERTPMTDRYECQLNVGAVRDRSVLEDTND